MQHMSHYRPILTVQHMSHYRPILTVQHMSHYRPILTVQSCSLVAESHIMLEHTPTLFTRYFPPFHPHVLELIRIPACLQDLHQICATSYTLY